MIAAVEASAECPADKSVQVLVVDQEVTSLTIKALTDNTGVVKVGSQTQIDKGEGIELLAGEEVTLDPSIEPAFLCEYAEDGVVWVGAK